MRREVRRILPSGYSRALALYQDPVMMTCEQCEATTEVRIEYHVRPDVSSVARYFCYARDWKATKSEERANVTTAVIGQCPLHGGAGYNPGDEDWTG